eukprot:SAG22_NODE_13_length_33548_cov_57.167773_3_plen_111_part_00
MPLALKQFLQLCWHTLCVQQHAKIVGWPWPLRSECASVGGCIALLRSSAAATENDVVCGHDLSAIWPSLRAMRLSAFALGSAVFVSKYFLEIGRWQAKASALNFATKIES